MGLGNGNKWHVVGEGYRPEEPGRGPGVEHTHDKDHDDDDEGVPFELEDLSLCVVVYISSINAITICHKMRMPQHLKGNERLENEKLPSWHSTQQTRLYLRSVTNSEERRVINNSSLRTLHTYCMDIINQKLIPTPTHGV